MEFKKASKAKARLRLAIDGPAGAGKTFTALRVATTLGQRVAVIDSEHGSASKYSHRFSFDTLVLEEYSLKTYLAAIQLSRDAGYDALVIDSLSHAWNGRGGALEQVDKAGKVAGWAVVTPLQNQLVESILSYPGHVVATVRSKQSVEIDRDAQGKMVVRKVGLQPVQRDGLEYEFDVVINAGLDGTLSIAKTRCPELRGGIFRYEETDEITKQLTAWLSDGVTVARVDELRQTIRGAHSRAELSALMPQLAELSEADKASLRDLYATRTGELP